MNLEASLKDYKKNDIVLLRKHNFPHTDEHISEVFKLKDKGVLDFILTKDGIKVTMLKSIGVKYTSIELVCKYVKSIVLSGRHYYTVEDEEGRKYHVAYNDSFKGVDLTKKIIVHGKTRRNRITNVKKVEEV